MFFLFACSMDVGQIIMETHYRRVAELKEMKLIENVVQIYGQNGATLFDIFSTFQVVHDRPLQKSLLKKSIEIGNIYEIPQTGRLCTENIDTALTIYDLLGGDNDEIE